MIEPMLSLAFSLHSNKGVYALLVGSGVSRSAGIPTGWEIVERLIRQLAGLKGENCEHDPSVWYKDKYGEGPEYSKLLDEIGKTPAARQGLIKSYFEPTPDDFEQGRKVPSSAHKAIAELAAGGYIRVIITTNFDRLIEASLESAGVTPIVISTPDAAEGAPPFSHGGCFVIKVHGDYPDVRIKNTPKELEKYDPRLNRLVDRIFDEFGLIVCGWSAEWDTALRAALERCKSHRYTTFWTVRDKLTDAAKNLLQLRRAETINIKDADSFFTELAEKVAALEDMAGSHPLSTKAAVATLKRYLPDERHRIRLQELLAAEVERLYENLSEKHFPFQGVSYTAEDIAKRMKQYERVTETLQNLLTAGCYWGEDTYGNLWAKCLQRIANPPGQRIRYLTSLHYLRSYPALILFYSGGIVALSANRYLTFASLVSKPQVREDGDEQQLVMAVDPDKVMDENAVGLLVPAMVGLRTPFSRYLQELLRDPLREFLPDDIEYQRCFDRFEYFVGLLQADLRKKAGRDTRGFVGCFGWRMLEHRGHISKQIESETKEFGENWPPLRAGLFGGSLERFLNVKNEFDQFVKGSNWC
jgi:hypothetical protein